MMKLLTKIALILILSLLTAPVLLLKGCGNTPTYGSTLSATQTTVSLSSISGPTCYTGNLILVDVNLSPLNGMPIQVYGAFAAPRYPARYRFYDGGFCQAGYERDSGFTGYTNQSGAYKFSIEIAAVAGQPARPDATCGTLGSTAYTYQIAAIESSGDASSVSQATQTCNGGVTNNIISWALEPIATAYAIIGRSFGPTMQLLAVVTGTSTTNYTDTGAVSTAGQPLAPTVTLVGTAGTTTAYTYAVVATGANGIATALSAAPSTAIAAGVGPQTLSTTNYNRITWLAGAPAGTYYGVYRKIGGGAWTLLAVVTGLAYNDTGSAANSTPSTFSDTVFATSGTSAIGISLTLN
ncbi:MAG TPA: hypothetical protein VI956_03575 [Nitrospirota bacterium]|nr:hypothetical protein [Nitrospirota bacterium]